MNRWLMMVGYRSNELSNPIFNTYNTCVCKKKKSGDEYEFHVKLLMRVNSPSSSLKQTGITADSSLSI